MNLRVPGYLKSAHIGSSMKDDQYVKEIAVLALTSDVRNTRFFPLRWRTADALRWSRTLCLPPSSQRTQSVYWRHPESQMAVKWSGVGQFQVTWGVDVHGPSSPRILRRCCPTSHCNSWTAFLNQCKGGVGEATKKKRKRGNKERLPLAQVWQKQFHCEDINTSTAVHAAVLLKFLTVYLQKLLQDWNEHSIFLTCSFITSDFFKLFMKMGI